MTSLAQLSPAGRLDRIPFAVAVTVVYVLSFLSQVLLFGRVLGVAGPWLFLIVQAALIWAWYVLHARRLRDAGRRSGVAIAVMAVYALAVILLVLIVTATASSGTPAAAPTGTDQSTVLGFFLIVYLLAILTGDPSLGLLAYFLMGVVALLLMPIVVAFGFSIWTAIRSPVPASP